MSLCANCGNQNQQGQDFCGRCGTPVAGQPEGKKSGHRLRIILVAAVAAIALVTAGTVWAVNRSGDSTNASDYVYNDVTLAGKPSLRWTKSINQLVGKLDCSKSESDDSSDGVSPCSVQGRWLSSTSAMLVVSNDKEGKLISLDPKTGDRQWTTSLAGQPSCLFDSDIAWCSSSTESDGQESSRPMELTTVDPSSGKKLGHVVIPGTRSDDHRFTMASGNGFGYFLGSSETSAGNYKITISKIDSRAKVEWEKTLHVTTNEKWSTLGAVYATIDDGKIYLMGAESDGKQVILRDSDGEHIDAGDGHVVGLRDHAVISQQGQKGMRVGGTQLSQTRFGGLYAADSGDGLPLVVSGGNDESGTSFTALDPNDPGKTLFHVSGYSPLAYCGGTLYAAKTTGSPYDSGPDGPAMQVEALDPETGNVKWHKAAKGYSPSAPWGAVRCSDGDLLLGGSQHLMKLDRRDGKTNWTVKLPHDGEFDYPQSGQQPGMLIEAGGVGHLTISYLA